MSSLADFARILTVQQEHDLHNVQGESPCQPPLGGAFSFGSKPLVRLLFIIVFLPCLLPIWLLFMPFRLTRKIDEFKQRFQKSSTAKKQ